MKVIEIRHSLTGNAFTVRYEALPAEPIRKAVELWLLKHNIDPAYVPVPGWIEVDPVNYRIHWCAFVPNIRTIPATQIEQGLHYEYRTLQLEAPPFPFPSVELSDYVTEEDE